MNTRSSFSQPPPAASDVAGEPAVAPGSGYRSYEVFQRERVGETTNLITPRQLLGEEYLRDPYPLLAILREHYPCYRDWLSNRFWLTRYDDVTSVFRDDANFETRPRGLAYATGPTAAAPAVAGRSLWGELDVEWAVTRRADAGLDAAIERTLDAVAETPDLAVSFATRFVTELWGEVFGFDDDADRRRLIDLVQRMQAGTDWDPALRVDGRAALIDAAVWFDELLQQRRGASGRASSAVGGSSDARSSDAGGDDLISAVARLDSSTTGADLAVTMLEADIETLRGGLGNLWFRLLTAPDQLAIVRDDSRMMKFAWLETLRHSPPVLAAERWARHEVERFGRLLPAGALVYCSAAAANRDPRAFSDPDRFDVTRTDLCQREPRGQYRADGLPSGIAFGLGPPSIHPADPKERPRSRYALVRDVAVAASCALLERFPEISLATDASAPAPELCSARLRATHTCSHLPVTLS